MDAPENQAGCCVDLKDILKTLEPACETSVPQTRLSQYKQKSTGPSQEERRRQYLQSVKERRQDFVAHARLIALGEDEDEEEEDEDQEMDTTTFRTTHRKPKHNRSRNYLKNQLMLSEWMVQLPEEFESQWLLVPCPVGKRCLVIASRGRTKAYSRVGQQLATFSSLLPGGNTRGDHKTYSILDCVFNKDQKLFYVLDIMCWKGHPVYDCDTSFRFYWLQTKLNEVTGLDTLTDSNQNTFLCLEHHPCTLASIQEVLSSPVPFPLDGLLFYHKACPYQQGVSPLVLWLKAYMIPEILPALAVPESLCTDRPPDYVSMKQYLVKTFKKGQQMDCD